MKNLAYNLKSVLADHWVKLAVLAAGSTIAYILLNAVSFAYKVS